MSQCEAFGLSAREAALEVAAVIEVVNTWRTHFEAVGVSAADIETLQERIDGDVLLSQREQFDPDRFSVLPKKRSPKNPFK
jgi:serine/threonine-protein kinase HipA